MSGLSTHILDLSTGKPAEGVTIVVLFQGRELARTVTNSDGRATDLLGSGTPERGGYRLVFAIGDYFRTRQPENSPSPFYDEIPIDFIISEPTAKYHVPLLVSPFGYSTYRGS